MQKGFSSSMAILMGVIAVITIGGGYYFSQQPSMEDAIMEKDEVMMENNGVLEDDVMTTEKENDDTMRIPSGTEGMTSYGGTVLAGSKALLIDFNKTDYDKAIALNKLVALYFYANWCPICRAEFPNMQAAFDELATGEVIGFRVNYNDNETDEDEKALARQFGVAYQHTKVLLKNGERILKSPDGWDKNRYLAEISAALE